MKYIMLETVDGAKLPIIFPDCLTHSLVAGAMQMAVECMDKEKDLRPKQCLSLYARGEAPAVSAGFVELHDVHVHGKSESLGDLPHKPADAARMLLGSTIQFIPDTAALQMQEMLKERLRSGVDSDLSVAIGEHAFKAGYKRCAEDAGPSFPLSDDTVAQYAESAWSEYTPPEELCGVSLLKE
jgi:hypothetical protein